MQKKSKKLEKDTQTKLIVISNNIAKLCCVILNFINSKININHFNPANVHLRGIESVKTRNKTMLCLFSYDLKNKSSP